MVKSPARVNPPLVSKSVPALPMLVIVLFSADKSNNRDKRKKSAGTKHVLK
jgi:hypothetical protein